jgi:hypothetical protein
VDTVLTALLINHAGAPTGSPAMLSTLAADGAVREIDLGRLEGVPSEPQQSVRRVVVWDLYFLRNGVAMTSISKTSTTTSTATTTSCATTATTVPVTFKGLVILEELVLESGTSGKINTSSPQWVRRCV